MDPIKNRTHWENWAKEYKDDLRATTKGKTLKDLELFHLISVLADDPAAQLPKKVLECGCGNGFNLLRVAEIFPHYVCTGFDFVEEMVENARKNLSKLEQKNQKYINVKFEIGDLRKVEDFEFGWDCIFTVRTLINLASLQEQLEAVSSMMRMLAPQGMLVLIENCIDSYNLQNHLREVLGLKPRTPAEFNIFVQERELIKHAESIGLKTKIFKNIGSLHDILLYVLLPKIYGDIDYQHPLVEEAKNLEINLKNYSDNLLGSVGQVSLFVFQKYI